MKFVISVLCLNRLQLTKACLEAAAQNSGGHEVLLLITNNASEDGTWEWLDEWRLAVGDLNFGVEVLHEMKNTGFIPPNNRAFRRAVRDGADYFIALNNDTTPPPGWLDKLIEPLISAPQGQGTTAAISGPQGTCCHILPDFHGTGGPYEYVEGSCLCAKVASVRRLGPELFSDYLEFIYGDDSDLSLRAQEKGLTIHQANFVMPHWRGETVRTQPEVMERCARAQERNHEVLKRRWAHWLSFRRFDYQITVRRRYALGDVLLATPIVRAIRKSFPLAFIRVETDTPAIFERNPNLGAGAPSGGGAIRDYSGSPVRPVSVDDVGVMVDLDMAYENRPGRHILEAYEEVAREALPGLGPVEWRTEIFPAQDDYHWAGIQRNWIGEHGSRLCLLHVGPTDWPGKNWPAERFNEIAEWLAAQGWKVAVIGCGAKPAQIINAVDWCGKSSLHQLAALFSLTQLFIGIDSFPLHCAQAMGCPAVGIFGVTNARYILTHGGPAIGLEADRAITCAGQRHRETGVTFVRCGAECVESVPVEQVKAAIGKLL